MAFDTGRVIENRSTGERIVVRTTGAATDGALFEFDLYLAPGGHVPARHSHPDQEERFTVLAGGLRLRMGRRTLRARVGDTVVVPPRTAHWFANPGLAVAHVRVEVRPALKLEDLFDEAGRIERSGLGPVARLSDLAALLLAFRHEVSVPGVPAALVRAALAPVAAIGSARRASARGRAATAPTIGAESTDQVHSGTHGPG